MIEHEDLEQRVSRIEEFLATPVEPVPWSEILPWLLGMIPFIGLILFLCWVFS